MKNLYKKIISVVIAGLFLLPAQLFAGNEDRSGQAGAGQLLINPFARSSGWGGANVACVRGLEGMYLNVAGTAFTKKTELIFVNTQYMKGSDISINAFGLTQKVGETGVIGISIMSMTFGDIDITTAETPDGGIGTFSPQLMNIGVSYAKAFSNSIYGGLNFRVISESISNINALGLALDAGIQYVTGETENIKFGIALKNVGTTMRYKGDGLSITGEIPGWTDKSLSVDQRSATFELPSLLNIGGSYDFHLSKDHIVTAAGAFTSNSFSKDQYAIGFEYGWRKILQIRAGFRYEDGIFDDFDNGRTTVNTGPTCGFSVNAPINKEKGSTFSIDYSYRDTDPWEGTHSIGVRVSL